MNIRYYFKTYNMCYTYKFSKSKRQLQNRFEAEVLHGQLNLFFDQVKPEYNGFAHPIMPIITNENTNVIIGSEWGLLPSWVKDKKFGNNTLNAKLETLAEKPSFKHSLNQRCLVPASGFLEWRWLDPEGKHKQKYLMSISGEDIFSFAGLYNEWTEPNTQAKFHTYTIITTEANEGMSFVHNSKKRMPVIISPEGESKWLKNGDIEMWNDYLIYDPQNNEPTLTLF